MDKDMNLLEGKIREKLEVKSGFGTVKKKTEILTQEFARYDTDKSGNLTLPEFKAAIKGMNFVLDEPTYTKLFKRWDLDNSNTLCYGEFAKGLFSGTRPKAKGDTKGVPQVAKSSSTVNPTVYSAKFAEVEAAVNKDINDDDKIKLLWKALDFNGNGGSTLAEIDKFVVERYPALNNKPALMRAYKRTCSKGGGGDGDDYVEKKEFKILLKNLVFYNQLFQSFDEIDTGDDRRVDCNEFLKGVKFLGLQDMKQDQLVIEFGRIDKNGGGQIMFDEFCEWYLERKGLPKGGGNKY